MGIEIEYIDGQTPLDEEEKEGLLISTITTHGELDEFEQQNIEKAIEWTLGRKSKAEKIITEGFVRELHHKMFGDVWKWAGEFRHTNKNLGCDWKQVSTELKKLNDDFKYWLENKTYSEEEIAIRYKHRIVSIHCFSNGNGRHSRLMGDVIISHVFGKKVFTWGGANLNKTGEPRKNYLNAIRQADKDVILPLMEFAKT
jgi:Fic-DOC domain mobile mystery protein B